MFNNCDLWAMEQKALTALLAEMALPTVVATDEKRAEPGTYTVTDGVAIVPVRGVLAVNPTDYEKFSGWATAFADIREMVITAQNDPLVTAVLLDIDSPGGMVSGTQETAATVFKARSAKPLYAWTGGSMTSAAYWIGSAAKQVGAVPTAQVGSIGVIATMLDVTKAVEQLGIKANIVKTGKWKAAGHPMKPMNKDERDYFQRHVDEVLTIFVRDVARFRGVNEAAAGRMSDEARVYLAGAAQAAGLIDGTYEGRDEFINTVILARPKNAPGGSMGLARQAKESSKMDLTQLKAEHPEVYEAAKRDGAAEAQAKFEAEKAAFEGQAAQAREDALGFVAQVADAKTVDKVTALMNAGVTPEQAAQLKVAFGADKQEGAESAGGPATDTSRQILEALQRLTPEAVADGGDPEAADQTKTDKHQAEVNALVAAANR